MKKLLFLCITGMLALVSCKRADNMAMNDNETDEQIIDCNKIYNPNSAVNYWGVLSRTTCSPSAGSEVSTVSQAKASANPLLVSKPLSNYEARVSKKACHFWFYGTDSQQLFKPVTYARVFVFDNDDQEADEKIAQAKAQILTGNHYLGFDTGVFEGIYPAYVLNIRHKITSTGNLSSSYNLESEIKRSLPRDKKIFIQFIIQKTPVEPLPQNWEQNKYAYCDFVNEDNDAYPHFKIDYRDADLGYAGNTFYYNN